MKPLLRVILAVKTPGNFLNITDKMDIITFAVTSKCNLYGKTPGLFIHSLNTFVIDDNI